MAHHYTEKGVSAEYTTNLLGNIAHIEIILQSDEYGKPLFTDVALILLRNFLYRYNARSVAIRLNFTETDVPTRQMAESLGRKLGNLIKSVPSIQVAFIHEQEKYNTTYQEMSEFSLKNAPFQELQYALTQALKKSTAHPILRIEKNISYCYEDGNQARDYHPSNDPIDYKDKRTVVQKIYHFFASIPVIGWLVRSIAHFIYGDSYQQDFLRAYEDIALDLSVSEIPTAPNLQHDMDTDIDPTNRDSSPIAEEQPDSEDQRHYPPLTLNLTCSLNPHHGLVSNSSSDDVGEQVTYATHGSSL